ncbi:MAG TPA: UdgX family uracil-DNA binding protein [Burkholderiaceae bacterium]|nr:UdgX family uracil-DNA binding protein [Burkholderiaceae bacterium]
MVTADPPERRLRRLRTEAAHCRECPLGERATQTVFGRGPAGAPVMLVGEQPGDREDIEGLPFVGPAGRLLDKALGELGLPRAQVYVTNAVKHFKFELRGKRRMHKSPGQLEMLACRHWLDAEIEAVSPRLIVALGSVAARALLQRPVKVLTERGRRLQRADGRPVLVTVHPASLLRGDPERREEDYRAWLDDLASLRDALAGST